MKSVIFGATGFIGSHVAEQLVKAGHEVTAVIRSGSDTRFLKSLGVALQEVNYADTASIEQVIVPGAVVYNCLAYRGTGKSIEDFRTVEVDLTRQIAEAAYRAGARRYIQLSSIIAYGTRIPSTPIDETYPPQPEIPIDRASLEREQVVKQVAAETGLDTVILQPASTIGQRDGFSFFHRILTAHIDNAFPMMNNGQAKFSCIDTRDVGRAMVWLGEAGDEVKGQTYLLKGYDVSWLEIKQALDQARGVTAKIRHISYRPAQALAVIMEALLPNPPLDRRTVHVLTHNRHYDDHKIRSAGFAPRYTDLQDTINTALSVN
jgi:dihydroflavonol-4-reductase